MAARQVDARLARPTAHGGQLSRGPHEVAVDAAGVAAVGPGVARGEDVVEAEQGGEGRDEVHGGGGGEHEHVALVAVGGEHPGGIGLHQLGQLGSGQLSGPAHRLDVPAAHEVRCQADHGHEGEALAHEVVQAVEEALTGKRPSPVEQALGVHGRAQDEPAGAAQQGAVEVDEHRHPGGFDRLDARAVGGVALRGPGHHDRDGVTTADSDVAMGQTIPPPTAPRPTPEETGPGRGKGTGGGPVPLHRLDRNGGGASGSCGLCDHCEASNVISQTAITDP